MQKTKFLSILTLSISLLFGIVACSNNDSDTSTTNTSQSSQPSTPPVTPPPTKSSETGESIGSGNQTITVTKADSSAMTAPPAVIEQVSTELELAKKSGCLACHRLDKKLVGPAWQDVAKRYAGDNEAKQKLIKKVSTGGKGNWTEVTGGVAMPPYSPRVSTENIEKLVDFVLSLQAR